MYFATPCTLNRYEVLQQGKGKRSVEGSHRKTFIGVVEV